MITEQLKKRILEDLARDRENFTGSDAKFATSIGMSAAQYSRIKRGETERVISEAMWITLARRLGSTVGNAPKWATANTPVFQYISTQLELCQMSSMSSLLCDLADIGKTYTALNYAKTHKNVVYVDCSQVKSKQKLIRYIAKSFGVDSTGKYVDVYEDVVYYIKTLSSPLIILDEAGDLHYEAFLEIKALWNATETACGYYMMGADGLKEKIHRAITNHKVGYTEIFSRFGKKYGKVIPVGNEEKSFLQMTAAMIIKANAPTGTDVNKVLRQTMGEDSAPSLRRIYKVLSKDNDQA
ncbi:MAG: ATP-binding protein [Bacteroidales bacterium]|nr:ATP-binding protein [Bacteroidales bacterium]MDD3201964.1 ATP-binding protein [Bacteroidales bacterium]